MTGSPLLLALDTGSPWVSVAVGRGGQVLAERSVGIERSSGKLLELVGEALAEVGAGPADLGGIVALRGPGSFTGLRIGLATALGFHQALGVPATALPTLQVLAAAAEETGEEGTIVAVVDALRGEWSAQAFRAGIPLGEMELVPGADLPSRFPGAALITGFGLEKLAGAGIRVVEAGPLAGTALKLIPSPLSPALSPVPGERERNADAGWNPSLLVHPLYSRPPAVTPPKPRRPPQSPPAGSSA